mgnify:CR=1 FL=1
MLVEQNYILLIFNCEKYRYKAQKQKETWLKELPSYLKYYHVLSLPASDRKSLTKSLTKSDSASGDYVFDDETHTLRVNAPDDYNSLPKKVFAAYKAIHETFSYKYIFKTDDDQMLNNPKFFDMIIGLINRIGSIHYGGHIVSVPRPQVSKYWMIHPELPTNLVLKATQYCNGRFYLLSAGAIAYLLTKKKEIYREFFEDYAIGYHLDARQFKTPILRINSDQFFSDIKYS